MAWKDYRRKLYQMNINHYNNHTRKIIYGMGTQEELESLNVEKDFETALVNLYFIRKSRKAFFDVEEPEEVQRNIYGRRKTG
jgi:hypothetical protein